MSITKRINCSSPSNVKGVHLQETPQSASQKIHFHTLALLVWMACLMPSLLLLTSSDRPYGEVIGYTPFTQLVRNLLLFSTTGYAAFLVARFGSALLKRPFGIIVLAILAVTYPILANLLQMRDVRSEIIPTLVSLTILLALFSLEIKYSDLKILGILGVATGAISLLMALMRPSSAYALEGGGRVLAGPFDNSNYLGIFLALLLPFTLLFERKLYQLIGGILILWPILISGSKTAIAASISLIVIQTLASLIKNTQVISAIFAVTLSSILAILICLPYLVKDPQAFTGRGIIWMLAQGDFSSYWLFGASHGWFEDNSYSAGYRLAHAHNILLQPIIVGGLGAFLLIISTIFYLIRYGLKETRADRVSPILFLQVFLIGGTLEQIFLLDARDLRYFATGFVIISLLSLASGSGQKRVSDGLCVRDSPHIKEINHNDYRG